MYEYSAYTWFSLSLICSKLLLHLLTIAIRIHQPCLSVLHLILCCPETFSSFRFHASAIRDAVTLKMARLMCSTNQEARHLGLACSHVSRCQSTILFFLSFRCISCGLPDIQPDYFLAMQYQASLGINSALSYIQVLQHGL